MRILFLPLLLLVAACTPPGVIKVSEPDGMPFAASEMYGIVTLERADTQIQHIMMCPQTKGGTLVYRAERIFGCVEPGGGVTLPYAVKAFRFNERYELADGTLVQIVEVRNTKGIEDAPGRPGTYTLIATRNGLDIIKFRPPFDEHTFRAGAIRYVGHTSGGRVQWRDPVNLADVMLKSFPGLDPARLDFRPAVQVDMSCEIDAVTVCTANP